MQREENVIEQPIGFKNGEFFFKFSHKNKQYKYFSKQTNESTVDNVHTESSHLLAYHAAVQKLNDGMTSMNNGYNEMDMIFVMQSRLMDRKDVKFSGQKRPIDIVEDNKPAITVVPTVTSDLKEDIQNILTQNKDAQRIILPIALKKEGVVSHMTGLVIEPPKKEGDPVNVYYFDPLGATSTYKELKEDIRQQIAKAFPGKTVNIISNNTGPEKDGKSCGPWSEWFLSEIAANPAVKIENMTDKCNEKLKNLKTNEQFNNFIQERYQHNKQELSQLDTKLTKAMKQAGINLEGVDPPKTHSPSKEEKEILDAITKAINESLQKNNISNTKVEREQNGHDIVVKSKENKEMFRASATSVVTKEVSDENLKAMSAAIVANLKTRLLQGGDPAKLKISLGVCKPSEVEEKLSKFINENLKIMKEELKTEKKELDTSKIKDVAPKTPTVKANIESENQETNQDKKGNKDTQQNNQSHRKTF